jgi:hypothetical protein
MAKGRDRRAAMIMLIGRGGLPATAMMFRQALRYLFEGAPSADGDALSYAEEAFADAQADRDFPRIERFMTRHAEEAEIVDPATGRPVSVSALIESAFVNAFAALLGRQFPDIQSITEVGTAYGFLGPELDPEERRQRMNYMEASFEDAFNITTLRQTAETVTPIRLQAVVLEILRDGDPYLVELRQLFPKSWHDSLIVIFGLGIVAIENLGGDAWFQRATQGIT